MPDPVAPPAALPALDREHSVDCLRGFALLGILAMNIVAFAYPAEAYQSPRIEALRPYVGEFQGLNAAIWWASYLLFDLKMMTTFSMLFGAGVVLLGRNRPAFAGLYYRRLAFLFAVGVLHAFVVWFGDILMSYALCGLILYPLRNQRPAGLILVGLGLVAVPVLIFYDLGLLMSAAPASMRAELTPPASKFAEDIAAVRSGAAGALRYNALTALMLQTVFFAMMTAWRVSGLMLIGMALMRLGFFSARWSPRAYAAVAAAGYAAGFAIIIPGGLGAAADGAGMEHMFTLEGLANYIGSPLVALAHAAMVMLAVRAGTFPAAAARLAAVGRMAFSNYLATSLLMTFSFYGWGLGLFARVERPAAYLFVLAVWALQLLWSPWWLARFHFGPLEWLWRTATYLAAPPMRRRPAKA